MDKVLLLRNMSKESEKTEFLLEENNIEYVRLFVDDMKPPCLIFQNGLVLEGFTRIWRFISHTKE